MTVAGEPVPRFEFATATRIVFGKGMVRECGPIARDLGRRALVVTGGHPDRAKPVLDSLTAAGVTPDVFPVSGEPTTLHVAAGVARARLRGHEVVIGFGGGSAIDAAKAIAGMLANERDLYDYLEVVGRGEVLTRPATPWIAIPTTAGAGAEVTRNAVLISREHRVKASLRSPHLLARVAIVDPQLTLELPPAVTAATGMDALTQLIEPFVSHRANPVVDALCLDGVRRIARALRTAVASGGNLAVRTEMSLAALFGGIALANAGLGAVHGIAAPVGGSYSAPHGAVCAALLAPAMRLNLEALRSRLPTSSALDRYRRLAQELTGNQAATAEDGVSWVQETTQALQIPGLRAYGIEPAAFADLAAKAAVSSSMKANPIVLAESEIAGLIQAAW